MFAAMGIEVSKNRIVARHSGDTILRYVADAPLRSLRADLGLGSPAASSSSQSVQFGTTGYNQTTAHLCARVRKLELAMNRMADIVQTQSQDIVGIAIGVARTDDRVFIQNMKSAIIHHAKANDGGRAMCGWRYVSAGRHGAGQPYRIAPSLANLPGNMTCEKVPPH